jgi:hypothetical protein
MLWPSGPADAFGERRSPALDLADLKLKQRGYGGVMRLASNRIEQSG